VRRSGSDDALFPTAEFEGKRLPVALAQFALLAQSNLAQAWRDDAILVAVEVEEHQSSDYALVLSFVSPRDNTGMQVRFTPHDSDMHYFRDVHWGDAPLPPDFVDLKPLLEAARKAGMRGALRKAELRVWKGAGPVWRIFPHGPRGVSFSALTGKRIEGDVTGYVAQYNADWNRAAKLWRKAMNRLGPNKEGYREYCRSHTNFSGCELAGCKWAGAISGPAALGLQSSGACYPDTWIEELNNRDPNRWRVFMQPPPAAWGKVR
jgi:hypothetical protein